VWLFEDDLVPYQVMGHALVSYSSSDEDEDRETKRPPLPPLSQSLLPIIPVDNPALHQGRTRSTPHTEGQWAAYVYVPLAIARWNELGNVLKEVICTAKQAVDGLHVLGDNKDEETELHISLTRPIYLRAHQREDLKKAVRAVAHNFPVYVLPFAYGLQYLDHIRFTASLSNFASLKNEDQTRAFLAMEIGAGHAQVALCFLSNTKLTKFSFLSVVEGNVRCTQTHDRELVAPKGIL
jgi:U6 snRNA phosphodiesterase